MRIMAGLPVIGEVNHVECAPGPGLAAGLWALVLDVEFKPWCPGRRKLPRVRSDGERQDRRRRMPSLGEEGGQLGARDLQVSRDLRRSGWRRLDGVEVDAQ